MAADTSTIRHAINDPSSFTTTLICASMALHGTGALSWGPAAIRDDLSDFAGQPLLPSQFDRLMAGVAILTTDRYRRSAADFCVLCNAINGDGHDHALWDPPDAESTAWFLTESTALVRCVLGRDDSSGWSAEVRRLAGETCRHEGLVDPPDVLRLGVDPETRSRDLAAVAAHSEDPGLHAEVLGSQKARNAAIEAELRARMRLLIGQLAALWRVSPAEVVRVMAAPA